MPWATISAWKAPRDDIGGGRQEPWRGISNAISSSELMRTIIAFFFIFILNRGIGGVHTERYHEGNVGMSAPYVGDTVSRVKGTSVQDYSSRLAGNVCFIEGPTCLASRLGNISFVEEHDRFVVGVHVNPYIITSTPVGLPHG